MSIVMELNPFEFFVDANGTALDNGSIWIGEVNKDPRYYPVSAFYDAALTIPAPMPLRTSNGYIARRGTPSFLYIDGNYSIMVLDKKGRQVYYVPDFLMIGNGKAVSVGDLANNTDPTKGAGMVGFEGSTVYAELKRLGLLQDTTKTYTVGTGGDYATINAALIDLTKIYGPVYKTSPVIIGLSLLTGFIMAEQVLLDGGIDLGWVRITSVDPVVTIDERLITNTISLPDDLYPAFGAINNSTLPVIACKFQYASNTTARDGVAVLRGSKVSFLPGAGVVRSRRGLCVFYGSSAQCAPLGLTQGGDGTGAGTTTGVDFSYSRVRGLHVAYGSRAEMARSDFSHSDADAAVYIIWNSSADLYQSNASYCAGTAFHSRDGSTLNCRESNGSHSKRAFHALHNSTINARSRLSGPTMIWIGDGAQFCTEYGVLASGNSHVEAAELNAGSCTGSAAVSASDASTINFVDGSAQDCTNRGVWSQNGSSVSAVRANMSKCGIGIEAISASTVAAASATITDCTIYGALATQGSNVDVTTATMTTCQRAVESRDSSTICARGANLSSAKDRAVSAIDGGNVNAQGANCSGALSRGITARNGSHVSAVGANCTSAGNWAAEVLQGSTIAFSTGTGSPINVAPNTISANGTIFQ